MLLSLFLLIYSSENALALELKNINESDESESEFLQRGSLLPRCQCWIDDNRCVVTLTYQPSYLTKDRFTYLAIIEAEAIRR